MIKSPRLNSPIDDIGTRLKQVVDMSDYELKELSQDRSPFKQLYLLTYFFQNSATKCKIIVFDKELPLEERVSKA